MKLLLVDDDPLIREAVQGVVTRLEPGAMVLAVGDSERGFAIADAEPDLDLVLLDLNIPGLAGIPTLKAWRRRYPEVPSVCLCISQCGGVFREDSVCADCESGHRARHELVLVRLAPF